MSDEYDYIQTIFRRLRSIDYINAINSGRLYDVEARLSDFEKRIESLERFVCIDGDSDEI